MVVSMEKRSFFPERPLDGKYSYARIGFVKSLWKELRDVRLYVFFFTWERVRTCACLDFYDADFTPRYPISE